MNAAATKPTKPKKKKHVGLTIFLIILVLLLLAVLGIGALGYYYVIMAPKMVVDEANAYIAQGSYVDAYRVLNEYETQHSYPAIFEQFIDHDKLTEMTENKTGITAMREKLVAEHPTVVLHDVKAGDVITFGHYEQDGNAANGTEAIEWIVLDIDEEHGRVLVVSRYCLACRRFNESNSATSWSKCSLREWLNKADGKYAFYGNAFSEIERQYIVCQRIVVSANSKYRTGSSRAEVDDYIFLLSADEAELYFADDEARKCEPTIAARTNGSYVPREGGYTSCRWWLRTLGETTSKASFVSWDGDVDLEGGKVAGTGDYPGSDWGSVRPAMWIQIEYLSE